MIPTYNEAEHIRPLVEEILLQDPRIEVLVVDDNSPDGTWRIVKGMASEDPRVHLVNRTHERGRGSAGIHGFRQALAIGADVVVEMDGDFSHDPRDIPRFIREIEACDVVVGSRFAPGGGDLRNAPLRSLVTRLAATYIRVVMGVRLSDPTSGYRCFRREALDKIGLHRLRSTGPSIVEEVLFWCHRLGLSVREIPIRFYERRSGRSKLTLGKLLKAAWFVATLRLRGGWTTG